MLQSRAGVILKAIQTVMLSTIVGMLLTGCGQKGSLYMPTQANPNTDFIIYKNNKVKPEIQQNDDENIYEDIVITDDPTDY